MLHTLRSELCSALHPASCIVHATCDIQRSTLHSTLCHISAMLQVTWYIIHIPRASCNILHMSFCNLCSTLRILPSKVCILHVLGSARCILHPTSSILHATCNIQYSPYYSLHATPYILHSACCMLHSTSIFLLHFYIPHSTPCMLPSTCYVLHATHYTWTILSIILQCTDVTPMHGVRLVLEPVLGSNLADPAQFGLGGSELQTRLKSATQRVVNRTERWPHCATIPDRRR